MPELNAEEVDKEQLLIYINLMQTALERMDRYTNRKQWEDVKVQLTVLNLRIVKAQEIIARHTKVIE